MKLLTIKDLIIAADLDAKSMSAVRGGTGYGWKMPSYCFPSPSYGSYSTTTTVSQSNTQLQNNDTGNGSAVFGGGIFAHNTQSAVNFNG